MQKPDFIAQIEGHGALNVNWQKNKVLLEVHEGERLFEGMVVGRPATDLYWITPRICGVCPIAHNMGALKAVEDALGLKPSPSTVALRKLLMDAQMIQSHVLHLYFLVAPDYLGLDSGVEIIKTHPKYFHQALELKRVSDLIADTVGGRGIHPTATYAGGFHKVPSVEKLKELKAEAEKMLEAAEGTVHLFSSLSYPDIKTNLVFFSQTNGKTYDTYEGKSILTSKKLKVKAAGYKKIIDEEIKPYSTAKFGKHKGRGFMVGSLARLNLQGKLLKGKSKEFFKGADLDYQNPYYNNLAQAIETYHFVQEANEILEELVQNGVDSGATNLPKDYKPKKASRGIGAVEAPRGSLYYEIEVDTRGLITECNIITPTVQNLSSMEESAQAVLDQTGGQSNERRQELMEALVRAYDPCITCSVH
ncbi:MAG TPA: Ni/Fe hydrogenase subunit alpha [Candidatus Nanoarchaeia archaeon]